MRTLTISATMKNYTYQDAGQQLPRVASFIGQQKRGIVSVTTLELPDH